MTENALVPFYRSFLLNRVVYLNELDKLSDEDLIPATDAELCKLIAARVDDWAPVDEDD